MVVGVASRVVPDRHDGDSTSTPEQLSQLPQLPPPPPSRPPATVTTAGSGAGNNAWREYLNHVVSLCNNAVDPPTTDQLRPTPDLVGGMRQRWGEEEEGLVGPRRESDGGACGDVGGGNTAAVAPLNGRPVVPGTPSHYAPVLVLVDMNGTLLYRAKKPLNLTVDGEPAAAAFVHGDPVPLEYYIRPGATEFVAAMARHPRVRLAFYTSMRGVNALPAARFLMPGDDSGATTPEVYDRPFNAHDPHGANHWDTTRDLPLIWKSPGRAGTGFGPSNTIMIDDTPRKMRFMTAGLVVVPEYTEACVVEAFGGSIRAEGGEITLVPGEDEERDDAALRQAEVMPRLTEYMRRLLEESGGDVRPFMECNRFVPSASLVERKEQNFSVACGPDSPAAAANEHLVEESLAARATRTTATTYTNGVPSTLEIAAGAPLPSGKKTREAVGQPLSSSGTVPLHDVTASATAPTTAAATTIKMSFRDTSICLSEAVGLVLTTGPLARHEAATAAAAADSRGAAVTYLKTANREDFDGFGMNVEASVVAAVLELLGAASAAAERWNLSPEERGRLRVWLGAAAAGVAS